MKKRRSTISRSKQYRLVGAVFLIASLMMMVVLALNWMLGFGAGLEREDQFQLLRHLVWLGIGPWGSIPLVRLESAIKRRKSRARRSQPNRTPAHVLALAWICSVLMVGFASAVVFGKWPVTDSSLLFFTPDRVFFWGDVPRVSRYLCVAFGALYLLTCVAYASFGVTLLRFGKRLRSEEALARNHDDAVSNQESSSRAN
jgi:hypothetical protein